MALRLSRTAVSVFFRSSIGRKQLLPAATHLISPTTTAFSQSTLPFTSSSARFFSSRTRAFDPTIEEIGPDTILFEGCDYNHWLITIDFPKEQNLTREQKIEYYVNTAAQVFGSVEEAKKKIYALSTTTYEGFQVECSEETSEKFRNLPGVVFILPDSYIDPVNKEYGGDKYINGEIIPRPPPVHYGRRTRDRRPREQMPYQMPYQQGNAPHNNQSQNYGPPPQQSYGPPSQQNYGPPPQQNYGAPPQQNYGQPQQQNYGHPPQQNYAAPPQQNYGQPPEQNYGAPPQQNYGQPPQQNYGAPPQQNYGPARQQNYGPPPQRNYGPSQNQSYRPPPQQNYGQPPNFQGQQSHSPASEWANNESPQGQAFGGQRDFSSSGNN